MKKILDVDDFSPKLCIIKQIVAFCNKNGAVPLNQGKKPFELSVDKRKYVCSEIRHYGVKVTSFSHKVYPLSKGIGLALNFSNLTRLQLLRLVKHINGYVEASDITKK